MCFGGIGEFLDQSPGIGYEKREERMARRMGKGPRVSCEKNGRVVGKRETNMGQGIGIANGYVRRDAGYGGYLPSL